MKNYLQKAYCMDQTVRIYAAITTDIVKTNQERFNMYPTSAAALGRALTIAAIMSCTYKNGEYLNIKINGGGPVGQITIDATDGNVRGYLENPGVHFQKNNGELAVGQAVGNNGFIEVIKDLHMRQPFSSSCEMTTGEIAEDFAYYFAKSEQIPSAVGLGESIDQETNKVKAAGGFLIQLMPGAKEEHIAKLEENLAKMKPCAKMIEEGYSATDIINEITGGDYELLEERELTSICGCSRDRFYRGVKSIGKDELFDILKTDKKAEITCNFCNTKYLFDEKDLTKMINEIAAKEESH